MTPIERAAKAAADVDWGEGGESYWLARARASLAAIEEPSEAMITAGMEIRSTDPYEIWRAMHKTMMEEGNGEPGVT